ncbi:MAG: class I SAM-dependent methyltransferase [Candidatus Marinimicrobia bacterium]|nr:class I SAM-dependent methyltransferase [Candidatus Neomarinimicrobiota bacterium]MCF7840468.1 class I SAM-dependent methyltransferase [Candidatus Neomarinimicrobiota bacterium]
MNIEQAYDIWADQYDTDTNLTRDLDKRATQEALSSLTFHTVIELGCGTGKNTIFLLSKAQRVLALDFSEKMLSRARKNITDKRVTFQKADITQPWEVPDHFADLITSSLVMEHIKDLSFIFSQARLKLKTGGHFFISELHPFRQYLGSRAGFDTENGRINPRAYTHHVSQFLDSARQNDFHLTTLREWFDANGTDKPPRLISFLFQVQK